MRRIRRTEGTGRIDVARLANHYLKALALCLAVSALMYLFTPDKPYQVPLVYSLCIGSLIWAIAEAGSYLLSPSTRPGWPPGIKGLVLVLVAVAGGYLFGTLAADRWFGWSSWDRGLLEQRSSWLVSLLAGGAGCYYFYSRSRQSQLHGEVQQAQRLAAEARLKLLQTQLEPHMLFNTLANLRALIAADPSQAQQMLDHLIAYLRATLGASRITEHPLSDEFDRLRDYLELMSVRMGARLCYDLDLPPALSTHPVPTLLLQPLVENAIRHGLEPKVQGGRIVVTARGDGDWLELEVADSGVGLAQDVDVAHGGGFGTVQVRERLQAAYGDRFTMKLIANDEGGTRALIRFPLQKTEAPQAAAV
ncbi:MAG: Autolysin sensor kinase [Burkholderiaceae bacterium]|jgi:hypothetical protein|nr:MAG: Autolysin sensor kinase [Burkholderiaceae bacterium]